MNIVKVSYGKTYNIGQYQSERIDLEASIDETKESVMDAVFQLREYCDQLHKKNNPHLYQETTPIVEKDGPWNYRTCDETPQPTITPEQAVKEQIDSATDLKGLEWQKPILKKFPELQDFYDQKHSQLIEKQLTNNQ